MAEIPPVIPPQFLPNCNCFGSTPMPFHPRFSALSDIDLDICEIIALALIAGVGSLDYNAINVVFTVTKCFLCMTPRQKREYEIWWVLYLTNCTTDDEMQTLINRIKGNHTVDEIKAALTGLRSFSWDYATCGDI